MKITNGTHTKNEKYLIWKSRVAMANLKKNFERKFCFIVQ